MTIEQFTAKRLINEVSGIANKYKRKVSFVPASALYLVLDSWYRNEITKVQAMELLKTMYSEERFKIKHD